MGHVKRASELQLVKRMLREFETPAVPARTRSDPTHGRVLRLVAAGQYERAIGLLKSIAGNDRALRNIKGVCLLRLGRIEEAVHVYHDLVLNPGCTWMRPDLPTSYKTNYATALLLGGHPSGCLGVLAEINDESSATVQRLRAAIRRWESELPFWSRLNWRIGRIDPANRPVAIEFAPGEFDIEVTPTQAPNPAPGSPSLRTAA